MPKPSRQRGDVSELEDEYAIDERGRRPDDVRRRNRTTGFLLLLLIASIVGITIWSRATGDAKEYNPVGEPADELGDQQAPERPDRSDSKR